MFRIIHGKGFHITFENGYTVSAKFGYNDECSNKVQTFLDTDDIMNVSYNERKHAIFTGKDCELSIWHDKG